MDALKARMDEDAAAARRLLSSSLRA